MEKRPILIAGKWHFTDDTFAVNDPYSGELLANVCNARADELELSLEVACAAAKEMSQLSRAEIAAGLRYIADDIERRRDEFAETIARESAKPLIYARGEADRAAATFRFAAGEAERFAGHVVPIDAQKSGSGRIGWTMNVPRGVIFGISPFNFPLNLVAHKVAPALASGNAIIVKPSDRTPLTALLLGQAFLGSGLPAAAFQVVPMPISVLEEIYEDERVNMISFTGSDKVGWEIKRKAVKKAVTLELGGNAAVIVDRGIDVTAAAEKVAGGAFSYSGQVCISVQRVFAHRSIFDELVDGMSAYVGRLVKGSPLDESTTLSVMIDEKAAANAEKMIADAVDGGASIVTGGRREGAMLEPTILTGTNAEMKIWTEEAFAPVVIVERFDDLSDAIEMVNRSRFGLQAGVFTSDLSAARIAAEKIVAGGVIINDVPTFRVDNMPYGGVKDSGFGREGVRYAMQEMTETRVVVLNTEV